MNTQTKQTQGPFSMSGITGDNHIMARNDSNGEKVTVAIVTGWKGIDPDELEANKRLFCFAPKTLAMLKHCLHVMETPGDFSERERFDIMSECGELIQIIDGEPL